MIETTTARLIDCQEAASPAFAIGVMASTLVHAGALAVVVLGLLGSSPSGGGGVVLEAISVELVSGNALESRAEAMASDTAQAASVADAEGVPAEAEPAQASAEARSKTTRPERPPEAAAVIATAAPMMAALASEIVPLPEPKLIEEKAPETSTEPQTRVPEPAAPAAAASGGAASRASETSAADSGARAGASPGEVNRYNSAVSRTISGVMRKLTSSGRRGALSLVFTVSTEGEAVDVRISEASGDAALDRLVLSLMRNASFPEPPARMTTAQRTFAVPIRVK